MAEIKEFTRKHYEGLDADKAGVTGVVGETYAATDTGKSYYWNVPLAAWKTGLGYEYVPRPATDWDKTVVDFTTDGTWKVNGLNLSGIVPAGAVAVVLYIVLADDAADSRFLIRQSAANDMNGCEIRVPVANINISQTPIINIDSDRLLDYNGDNLAFVSINIAVTGWYI